MRNGTAGKKKDFASLEPSALWRRFADLCRIPHPSKSEGPLALHLKNFALKLGLDALIDNTGNLIIRKKSARHDGKGRLIVLQAHLDMVAQKNSGSPHDFATDPIKPRVDGGWVRADGTTLGADNGIGVAAILAVLSSNDIRHGPLEALLTVNEEAGMTGAAGLQKGLLKGRLLVNLDNHKDDEICVGCAGAIDTVATAAFPLAATSPALMPIEINLKGLRGGHSGLDINLGRGNANKLLARLLLSLTKRCECRLCSFVGGTAVNAIPREATAIILVEKGRRRTLAEEIKRFEGILRGEFGQIEPDLSLTTASASRSHTRPLTTKAQLAFLQALICCADGVIRSNPVTPDLIELSNNIGIVVLSKGKASVKSLQRSSTDSLNAFGADMVRSAFELANMTVSHPYASPPWTPNFSSPLLAVAKRAFLKTTGADPRITVTHGGLECKLFSAAYPGMQIVSIGAHIQDLHSPDERVEIASVDRMWRILVEILQSV